MKKYLGFFCLVLFIFLFNSASFSAGSGLPYPDKDFWVNEPEKDIQWHNHKTTAMDFIAYDVKTTLDDLKNLIEPHHVCEFAYILNPNLEKYKKEMLEKKIDDFVSSSIHVKKIRDAAKAADLKLMKSHSQTERSKIVVTLNKLLHQELAAFQKEFNDKIVKAVHEGIEQEQKIKGGFGPWVKFVNLQHDTEAGFSPTALKGAISKEMWHKKRTLKESLEWDAKLWETTIFPVDPAASMKKQNEFRQILVRLFALLHKGGVKIRTSDSSNDWVDFSYPTASLLSRGGRVLVVIKKSAGLDLRAVSNWIVSGKASGQKQLENSIAGFKHRLVSSHEITFANDEPKENKKTNFHNNYAMDLAFGGYGSEGADGSAIQPNGRFAHLLLVLGDAPKSSKTWQTGFLVGVENSAPQLFNNRLIAPKGHLGTVHDASGKSAEISITNDAKWYNFKQIHNEADEKTIPGKHDCVRLVIESKKQFDAIKTFAEGILKTKDPIKMNKAVIEMLGKVPETSE